MVVMTNGEILAASSLGFPERRVQTGAVVPNTRQHALLSPYNSSRSDATLTLINSSTFPVGKVRPVTSST